VRERGSEAFSLRSARSCRKEVNTRVAAAAGVSPDDLMITLYEAPGENFSFGRGEAQRANAVAREQK
jgi:hypothetical protein